MCANYMTQLGHTGQGSLTSRIYVYGIISIERYFKELAHMFMGAGKPKICRTGRQTGHFRKS